MKPLGDLWTLFLADRGFAASLLAVFVVAGVLQFVFLASLPTVLAVIGLGCMTALVGVKVSKDNED
jgi:hypothetical protein